MNKKKDNILITGSAGFIGSALSLKLLEKQYNVVGVDNFDNYYDTNIKKDRLARNLSHNNYKHFNYDISKKNIMEKLFEESKIKIVINLAAQPGVRYSLVDPNKYIDTNITGFTNLIEESKNNNVEHFIYASSSSVYGLNQNIPFSTEHNTNHPANIYAASKKMNELIAHAYSHLYDIPTTGLRFFTVYGPWDRPDMALQLFADAITNNKPIKLFNYGRHKRDFTYIDDIVEGILKVIQKPPTHDLNWDPVNPSASSSSAPYKIYNIGNNSMIDLEIYINLLEKELGKEAKRELLPMQSGDIESTLADVNGLIEDFGYQPTTPVESGIKEFASWYKNYYKK